MNKIDLPQADPDGVALQLAELLGDDPAERAAHLGEDRDRRRGRARRGRRADPGADGRSRPRRARALIFDSSYDQYRGVVAFVRVVDGAFHPREDLRAMALGTRFEAQEIGAMSPVMAPLKALVGRRGRLRDHRAQGGLRAARRRHADRRGAAGRRAAPRLQGRQADGVRRALPDGLRRLPRAARRAREAEAERRRALLRARDLAGARLRLPLRLPRPAAHGDRPRAARARVRPRPARHRADRRLPRARARTRPSGARCTRRPTCPTRSTRSRSRTSRRR